MARRPGIDPRLIDQHNRVALPKAVLEALKARPGSHVSFIITEGRVEIRRVLLTLD